MNRDGSLPVFDEFRPGPRRYDLTGIRFGFLVAMRPASGRRWLFDCDCGRRKAIPSRHVLFGLTSACGRLCPHTRAMFRANREEHGDARRGAVATEYAAWKGMIRRCHDPREKAFRYYGAKGVTVCARWRASYPAFLTDMGRKSDPGLTLDRIDPFGNYEPGNCRWATWAVQHANKRRNARAS